MPELTWIGNDGSEGRWRVSKEKAQELLQKGELELSIKKLGLSKIKPC